MLLLLLRIARRSRAVVFFFSLFEGRGGGVIAGIVYRADLVLEVGQMGVEVAWWWWWFGSCRRRLCERVSASYESFLRALFTP